MAGSALSQLLDFYAVTGPSILTGPESIVNEAQERSYMLSWFLSGNGEGRLQGGNRIKDFIMFDAGNTAEFVLPGATRTYSNPQVTDEHAIDWRFLEDHMTFIDAEIELNMGGLSREAKFQAFKRVMAIKEKRLATSLSNKMEAALFAQPDATTMEGTTAAFTNPYSLFCFANEFGGSGTAETLTYGTGLPNGFTTIANLNPTTEAKWRPAQVGYAYGTAIDTTTINASAASLMNAFAITMRAVNYEPLPWHGGESTTNKAFGNDYVIACSLFGSTYFEKVQRASRDHFRQYKTDPSWTGPWPDYNGIPVKHVALMDTAAVYPTSGTTAPAVGSGVVEMSGSAAFDGPRYMFLAKEWVKPVFQTNRYFYMRPDIVPSAQPDTTVKPVVCWYNFFPRSRRKLGFVYPTT